MQMSCGASEASFDSGSSQHIASGKPPVPLKDLRAWLGSAAARWQAVTRPIQVFVIVIKAQATLQQQFLPVQGPTGPTWVAFTAFCSSSVEVLVLVVVCPAPPPPPPSPRQETGPNKR
ncbi:unnamed protein product [Lampetra fluviatilis]